MVNMKRIAGLISISAEVIITMALMAHSSLAQKTAPQFLVTWRASSYAPADYRGKILPTPNSLINISFELIVGGKPADLSKQTIYWYLNDDLLTSGPGKQSIGFVPMGSSDTDTASVRIQIPGYSADLLLDTIDIQLVSPTAVIYHPAINNNFSGNSLQVTAVPYFFNVDSPSSLNYSWNVNGETPANLEEPSQLTMNMNPSTPSGSAFDVELNVTNPRHQSEAATVETMFVLAK